MLINNECVAERKVRMEPVGYVLPDAKIAAPQTVLGGSIAVDEGESAAIGKEDQTQAILGKAGRWKSHGTSPTCVSFKEWLPR